MRTHLSAVELWNNQFPETKILGLRVSRRMRGLVYMASRDKVDVDTFHKGIQYALEKLGKSKFGFEKQYQILKAKDTRALGTSLLIIPELRVLVLTKRHVGSGNEMGLTSVKLKLYTQGNLGLFQYRNLTEQGLNHSLPATPHVRKILEHNSFFWIELQ